MNKSNSFLDADTSLLERNLRIVNDPEEEEFQKFLKQTTESLPCKTVKPMPGFCIKTRELGTEKKIFVNICQTDALPAPRDISEKELQEILESDDPSGFRIPMSIGEIRSETDKKGGDAKAVDIAINPNFFKKLENSELFKDFFIAVVFEGITNKYNVATTDERILLKNKKAYGTLQVHRIQQREIDQKMGKLQNDEKSILDNINKTDGVNKPRPKIETLSSIDFENVCTGTRKPPFILYKRKEEPNLLIGEFRFPDVLKSEELTLDVGEDRILLECKAKKYLLDIFLPCLLNEEEAYSEFNTNLKVLTLKVPIKDNNQ